MKNVNLKLFYISDFPVVPILISFLIIFGIYLRTLCSTIYRDDTPEIITAISLLGIAHHPGYPLYTLLGHIFQLKPLGNPAFLINLYAAFISSIGCVLFTFNLWLLFKTILKENFSQNSLMFYSISVLGGFLLAFSKSYWNASLSAKGGVYIFQLVIVTTIFILFLKSNFFISNNGLAAQQAKPENLNRWLFLSIFSFSLGITHHWPLQFFLLPSIFITMIFSVRFVYKIRLKTVIKYSCYCFTIFLLGISPYLYLPIRACQYPFLNTGDATNLVRFATLITRLDSLSYESGFSGLIKPGFWNHPFNAIFTSIVLPALPRANYISSHTFYQFGILGVFAILGVWPLYKTNIKICLFLLLLFLSSVISNIFYMNLSSIEFWHLDDYLLLNDWAELIFCVVGCSFVWIKIKDLSCQFTPLVKRAIPIIVFILILLFAGDLITNNYRACSKDGKIYHDYGLAALRSLNDDSVFFAETDFDYFGTIYLNKVENFRPDITILGCPFLMKNYPFTDLKKQYPVFSRIERADFSSKETSQGIIHDLIYLTDIKKTFFCTYTNGIFNDIYLGSDHSVRLSPQGILLKLNFGNPKINIKKQTDFLHDFWHEALEEENINPDPVNYILYEACAHPFLNSALFLRLKGDLSNWDWFFERGLFLIRDINWQAHVWNQKATGDLFLGETEQSQQAFSNAGFLFWNSGDLSKAKENLKKALTLNPHDQLIREAIYKLGS